MNAYRITRVVTPAASLDLVSLDQAKELLGIPASDTSEDAAIGQHISAVSAAINNFCDRIFAVQEYRDQARNAYGCWGEPFVTRQYPIAVDSEGVPIVAITEEGAALDPAMLEVDPDTGRLYRLDTTAAQTAWGASLLLVDYTAGYQQIPPDVQGACLEWVQLRYRAAGRDPGLRSETVPDLITQVYGGSGADGGGAMIPPTVRDWLYPYRMWSV